MVTGLVNGPSIPIMGATLPPPRLTKPLLHLQLPTETLEAQFDKIDDGAAVVMPIFDGGTTQMAVELT